MRRCLACQRALWRRHKAASDARIVKRRYLPKQPDLAPEAIEAAYTAALKAIKAQRWSSDLGWRSTAALVVEAA
jgi:hypothetical protein